MKFTDDMLVLMCAFRYALGRRTYIVSFVVNEIISNWNELPIYMRQLVHNEINEAIKYDTIGDECDLQSWRTVLALDINDNKEDNK